MDDTQKLLIVKQVCKKNIEAFAAHYLKNELILPIPPFHVDIYKDLANWNIKRLVIIAPTGFGKSCVAIFAYPVYLCCFNLVKKIVLLSNTATFAERKLRDVKAVFESNERIRSDFGVSPGNIWTHNEIRLSNGVEILSLGSGSQITGERPDVIISDDIQTEKEAKSEIERASLEFWWFASVMNRPSPDGRIIQIGSISSPLSFLNKFKSEDQRKTWTIKEYATKHCKTIWKEKWSDTDLEKKKLELISAPGIYEALYEGDASKFGKYAFKKGWLRFYTKTPEGLRIYTALDPGAGENEGDCYTGIVTGGIDDRNGLIYILDVIKRRYNVNTLEMFAAMFMVRDIYHPLKFGIEIVVFQKYIQAFYEKECRERGIVPSVLPIKRDTKVSKDFRIRSLAHWFEEGRILIRPEHYSLIAEYESYPECATKDVLDALSMLVNDMIMKNSAGANTGVKPSPPVGLGQRKFGNSGSPFEL